MQCNVTYQLLICIINKQTSTSFFINTAAHEYVDFTQHSRGCSTKRILLPALFLSSHLALVNVCYDKEQSELCPSPLRIGLTTFTRFHIIAKMNYFLRHVCLSVRSLGTTGLALVGFSRNMVFEYFSKICQ